MKKNYLGIGCVMMISVFLLTGCSQPPVAGDNTKNTNVVVKEKQGNVGEYGKVLDIVTTFPPLYAHAANLIDENDTLTNLVPPGTSVHFWQPKPSDIVAMEEADIIITNGLGLEEFLDDYLEGLEKKGVRILDTSVGIETIEVGAEDEHDEHEEDEHEEDEHEEDEHEEDEHEDEHHHDGPDPHIRLDTKNAQTQVENISQALAELDPTQASFYTAQAGVYKNQIQNLDNTLTQEIQANAGEPFIVFHDAYQYFLRAYDLADMQVGLVQEFHGDNPSQKEIAELIETIISNEIATIYTEPQFNPTIVQSLKQETGVQTKEIDPIGTTLHKEGYIELMSELAKAFTVN